MSSVFRLIEYFAVRVLAATLQAISPAACAALMRGVARLVYLLDRRHRRRAIEHLRIAYGDELTEKDAEALARRVFDHIANHAAEFAHAPRRPKRGVRLHRPDILLDAVAGGKGVVLVGAHLGYFTVLGPVLQALQVPSTVLLKRQHNERLLRWFQDSIQRWYGIEGIVKSEALEKTPSRLRDGRVVIFFADQHPIAGGIPATFFSKPVEAATGPSLFARRYHAPLVVVTTSVRRDGSQDVRFDGPVSTEGTLAEISQRWLDLLEARIREHPDQWMWMHRRWREPVPALRAEAAASVACVANERAR
ncbi:MAG TPA: lysophospholipid acyltransferase family protein [Planctomycetota bacterium]|nr:lysophospholipid acyltransferase family protein [Planctomycetota bacterium]